MKKKKKVVEIEENKENSLEDLKVDESSSTAVAVRRSKRLRSLPADEKLKQKTDGDEDLHDDDNAETYEVQEKRRIPREKTHAEKTKMTEKEWKQPNRHHIGPIGKVQIGTVWKTRMACSHVGVHCPPVAGIHGNEKDGCYSLALSGGYEDDVDLGEAFTYTGEGGRDLSGTHDKPKNLRTAPQTKDQILSKGNLSLKISCEKKQPIRVIRGYKLKSPYAPEEGTYRYDGLYIVEKVWTEIGLAGFLVYKFALTRIEGHPPLPVRDIDAVEE